MIHDPEEQILMLAKLFKAYRPEHRFRLMAVIGMTMLLACSNGMVQAQTNVPPVSRPHITGATKQQQLFMQLITQIYQKEQNGNDPEAPVLVEVDFYSFTVGKPVRNRLIVSDGKTHRINDAAPLNATLYPTKAGFVVTRIYGTKKRTVTEVNKRFDAYLKGDKVSNEDRDWVVSSTRFVDK